MIISGAAKLAGVIGWPITHSRSPAIHGFWLEQYGIDGAYIPLGIDPKDIGQMFDALPKLGFRGWNVTLPHKEDAFRLVHERTQTAAEIGAVNTVTVQPDGSLHGDNSDAFGFMAHLDQSAPGWPKDRPAVVLGAGGAARAVCSGLLQAGVPSLRLTNRTRSRAEALAAAFDSRIEVIDWDDRSSALAGAGLLTNTTSLGMTKQPPLEIALDDMPDDGVVYDIVYVPLETDLLAAARVRNLASVDGLGMLLHQARPGFHRWFGVDAQVTNDLHQSVVRTLQP
jgi:shikimate dehydrogenase